MKQVKSIQCLHIMFGLLQCGRQTLQTRQQPSCLVSFNGGTGAAGTAPTQAANLRCRTNSFTKIGYTFAGWNDGTTIYQEGSTYTMPANAVTFTAQWMEATHKVTGKVIPGPSDPPVNVSGATVKLIQKQAQIGLSITTEKDGLFTISNVPNGTYNLVVKKGDITVTSLVVVSGADKAVGTITLPAGKQNSWYLP